ncbi:phosphotransferase enzyme family protein [Paenibacillus pinihumi]|uniref:phosphotransferase enzyme family protein n=1 Tax=Paenibacillus pinihumi TaxID=669462 RepID=UPI0003F79131|nr:phosphotransferase [Paenibacillus pinihumi]
MNQDSSIVQEALHDYSIKYKSFEWIGQSANTIYKITDQENNSYSLRIHTSKSGTLDSTWIERDVIHSEMIWLENLSCDSDLTVPVPVRNSHGEFITEIKSTFCTLLKWVNGEQKPFITSVDEAGSIGEMIGRLHKHSSMRGVPRHFHRPSFDTFRILQALEKLKALADTGQLEAAYAETLQLAGQRITQMMDSLQRTPLNWGIIHADLIPSNIVFHNGEARPIDFGACGFGYFLFDLGWCFSYIHPALRQPLLAAYSKHYELPDNYIELLEGFLIAGQLETMNFWLGLPDFEQWLPQHIGKLCEREVASFLKNDSFLFSGTPYWE